MWSHGYPMELLFAGRTGHELGGHPPESVNVLPPSITVGGHMVHAVGIAWAERLRGSRRIALTVFGDGATSEGDFHEAMNFAGGFRRRVRVPVPEQRLGDLAGDVEAQTAAERIAEKAAGYGMPGVQVDGNDVFAVYAGDQDRRGPSPGRRAGRR